MDDTDRLSRLLVVRRAKIATAERALQDLAAQVRHASEVLNAAEAAAAAVRQEGLQRIRRERTAILSAPFHNGALAELKTTAATVEQQVSAAEAEKRRAANALTAAETARSNMAQIVLSGRARADRLGEELTRQRTAAASRHEARVIEEFGDRKIPEK